MRRSTRGSRAGGVDYPSLCAAVSRRVTHEEAELAIVLGGSGQGEMIACNKIRGVRAGLAYSHFPVDPAGQQ
ncbi:RpiB/LacA/LacB family sugar-phosphate isomerase [Pseudarthrobacter oxydans]|uniref:RpiB/LacA/LacB family sugar-phosphate isomerase n=1 Tax=Pseudarthrobacter oxydans TaxID=1671 RepID=UPI0037F3F368